MTPHPIERSTNRNTTGGVGKPQPQAMPGIKPGIWAATFTLAAAVWLAVYLAFGWAGVAGLAAFVLFTGALVAVEMRVRP